LNLDRKGIKVSSERGTNGKDVVEITATVPN
jgi:hypothetical protein